MFELIEIYLQQNRQDLHTSLEIFKMAKRQCVDYITPHLRAPVNRIAFLGVGNTLEVKPILYAIAHKDEAELRRELSRHPSRHKRKRVSYISPQLGISTVSFDYDLQPFYSIRENPFSKIFIKGNTLVQASFTNMPVPDHLFDLTVIRNPYWDELEKQGTLPIAFHEFIRITKPGGILWMTFLSQNEYMIAVEQFNNATNRRRLHTLFSGENTLSMNYGKPNDTVPMTWDAYVLITQKRGK